MQVHLHEAIKITAAAAAFTAPGVAGKAPSTKLRQ